MLLKYKIVKKASVRYNAQNLHAEIMNGKIFLCMDAVRHSEEVFEIDTRDVDMNEVVNGTIPSNWLSRIFQNPKNEVRYLFGTEENQTLIYFNNKCYLIHREVNSLTRDLMDGLLYIHHSPEIMYLSGYGLDTTLNDVFNPVGIVTELPHTVRELSQTVTGIVHFNQYAFEFSQLTIDEEALTKVMTTRKNTLKILRYRKDWFLVYRAANRRVYVYTLTDALNLLSIKK